MKFTNCISYFLAIFLLMTIYNFAESEKGEINNGQDFTKPLPRLVVCCKYQDISEFSRAQTFTLRADKPFNLNEHWVVSTRVDLPYTDIRIKKLVGYRYTILSPKKHERGLSDLSFQALFITPTYGKWTFAFGLKLCFPTAQGKNLGSGKYQMLPTFSFKYDLKNWINGAWCALLVRQDFDIGGARSRRSINQTCLEPIFNIDLPYSWFVTLAPKIRYNWKHRTWFVPFDIQIGKMLTEKMVLSLEYKKRLVDNFPVFRQEIELRLGYFF